MDLIDKLIRVERSIGIYHKYNGEQLEEVNIDTIPIDILKTVIIAENDDPLLYSIYPLSQEQVTQLNTFLISKITPDFELYNYELECYGIYDWDKK